MGEVTNEHILAVMQEGFEGIHRRQDVTNGRVLKLEGSVSEVRVEAAKQDERINSLTRAVFRRRDEKSTAITQRDVTIGVAVVVATVAFLKFLAWIAPAAAVVKP